MGVDLYALYDNPERRSVAQVRARLRSDTGVAQRYDTLVQLLDGRGSRHPAESVRVAGTVVGYATPLRWWAFHSYWTGSRRICAAMLALCREVGRAVAARRMIVCSDNCGFVHSGVELTWDDIAAKEMAWAGARLQDLADMASFGDDLMGMYAESLAPEVLAVRQRVERDIDVLLLGTNPLDARVAARRRLVRMLGACDSPATAVLKDPWAHACLRRRLTNALRHWFENATPDQRQDFVDVARVDGVLGDLDRVVPAMTVALAVPVTEAEPDGSNDEVARELDQIFEDGAAKDLLAAPPRCGSVDEVSSSPAAVCPAAMPELLNRLARILPERGVDAPVVLAGSRPRPPVRMGDFARLPWLLSISATVFGGQRLHVVFEFESAKIIDAPMMLALRAALESAWQTGALNGEVRLVQSSSMLWGIDLDFEQLSVRRTDWR